MGKLLKTIPLLLVIMVVLLQPSFGQREGVKILGLRVRGNKTSNTNMILSISGLSVGEEVTGDEIQKAIKRLWALGIFSDIKILLDRETPEGVYLAIEVREYPRLQRLVFKGNKKIKTKDLETEIDLYPGQLISPQQILKAKKKIKRLYEKKGYLLAQIQTVASKSKDKIVLKFNIKEGKKVKIKRIRFFGNHHFSDGKLKKQLKNTKEDRWWRGGDFKRDKYEEDLQNLIAFYKKEGFRDAEIVSDTIYYAENRKDMFIDIKLREGERYKIRKILWEGNKLFTNEQLSVALGIKEGDVYNQEKLQKAVTEKLGSLYYDKGYIWAMINPREIPVGKDKLDIHFTIMEGSPARVNKIYIKGNTKTKDKVIRRELKIKPGDIFNRAALMRSQRDVWVLNYFSNVTPDIKPIDNENVDLIFKVEEKSTDLANMSAGWSEQYRLMGNIGISMNNLFGNGQSLSFNWDFARHYRQFRISFTEPWLLDTPTLAGFSFYDIKSDSSSWRWYSQRSRGGTVRIGRRLRWPDNYFRGDWIYRLEQTDVSGFYPRWGRISEWSEYYSKGPLASSSITQIITRDSRDRPEFPTSGSMVSLSTEVAGGPLGGDVDYHKHIFNSQWFFPLPWKLVLLNQIQAGYIGTFTKSSLIPPLELFFMGGDGMSRSIPLRGYPDPLIEGTPYQGGRTMLKYSIELRFPIITNPTAFGLIFAEAGNTWLNLSRTDPFDLRRSVGIGVRIFMPMLGVIGFDYAYSFDNYNIKGERYGKWLPHFVFGRGF